MTRPQAGETEASASAQARLSAHLAQGGYRFVTPPVLQPVEPFLELSGEDIRRRIFVTQDSDGAELCLRPELTIPVCRLHLAGGDGRAAEYSYCGPVFRLAADEPDEFLQAGIESIGRTDTPAADAEVTGETGRCAALLTTLSRASPYCRLRTVEVRVGPIETIRR